MKKGVFVKKGEFDKTLATPAEQGKRLLDPLKTFAKESGFPVNILEDKDAINDAEVHTHEDDLWYCLEGEVTFTYNGEMVDSWVKENPDGSKDYREVKAKEIKNGTVSVLKPGDWLWIPAGVPHKHDGTGRLVIIKIPRA